MTHRKQGDKQTTATLKERESASGDQIQGEGDYVSARRYQKEAHEFAEQHDTSRIARDAAPKDEVEAREMLEAERQGRARAKDSKQRDERNVIKPLSKSPEPRER